MCDIKKRIKALFGFRKVSIKEYLKNTEKYKYYGLRDIG